MKSFYTKQIDDKAVVYFLDDTYLATAFLTVDRPATADDIAANQTTFDAYSNSAPTTPDAQA